MEDLGISGLWYTWRDRKGYANIRCACSSLKQLGAWFGYPDMIRELSEQNFVVSMYHVRLGQVLAGDYQVIYDRRCAVPVERMPVKQIPLMRPDATLLDVMASTG